MEKIFIPLYRFFAKRQRFMYFLLIISTLIFGYYGLKVEYEENIAKLLPQTESATESGLAFGNLRVKDKIFIQLSAQEDTYLTTETLAAYTDEFVETLLTKDSATHYIAHILSKLDDDLIMMGLDHVLTYIPTFIDESTYDAFDSLLTPENISLQMKENYRLVMNDEEGNLTTMVSQDPAALRKGMLPQGKSLAEGLNGFTMIEGQLFSPDSTVALAFIAPNFNAFNSKAGTQLIELIEQEITSFQLKHPDIEILFHGSPVQSVFNSRQIKSDLALTIGLSLLIICLAIGICFRNYSTLWMLLAPIGYGTFFALACMYWIKGSMSLMAIGIGAIVLGVALSYCLHVLTHYKYVSDPIQILRDQATPVCLGCLTTIGAFLGLLFTQSDLLKDFGLFSSFALVGTTLFALIFLPHFFRPEKNRRSEKAFNLLDRINSYPLDRKTGLKIAISIVCLVCFFTSDWVTFDSNLRNIGYNEPKVIRSNELYAEKINRGNTSMYYASTATDLDSALLYNKAIINTLDSLEQLGIVKQYSKTSSIFIPIEEQEKRINQWYDYWNAERIATTRKHLTESALKEGIDPDIFEPFYMMIEGEYEPSSLFDAEVLPESLLSNFIEKTADGHYLVFTSAQMTEDAKQIVNKSVASQPNAVVIDPFFYTNDMVRILNDDFNTVLGISSIFVFIVLLVSFRSIPLSILAFIPMSLSWYVVRGIMGIIGLEFNLINIIIATFIFGIGVDYSIFVMNGLIAQATGRDYNLLTYHKTAIFFSAFVLIVVVSSLLFATHPAIHSIGVSTLIGMSATILITYTLQPALFRWMQRFKFFNRSLK